MIASMGEMAQRTALGQGGMDIFTIERLPVMTGKAQILSWLGQKPLVGAVMGGMADAALTIGKGFMGRPLVPDLAGRLMAGQTQGRRLAPQLNPADQPVWQMAGHAVALRHRLVDVAAGKFGPHFRMAVKAALRLLPPPALSSLAAGHAGGQEKRNQQGKHQ